MGGRAALGAAAVLLLVMCNVSALTAPGTTAAARTFTIENDRFVADGKPVQIISGCLHYFRIPRPYWQDRLLKMRAMGLNAIEFYVPWNFHERLPGQYTWEGEADLDAFIAEIQAAGLIALLRPGPYICAEWDFGGLPWWLANSKTKGARTMQLRSDDPDYLSHVQSWWKVLLGRVRPHLWQHGGPIAMVQIENEYGFCGPNYGPDRTLAYLRALVGMARESLGDDVVLYTTDPPNNAPKGTIPGGEVFTAVDFGANWWQLDDAFGKQRALNPPGKSPPICTEYYTGWLTHWGEKMANTSASSMVDYLGRILAYGNGSGSVSFYMAHGGTNFGFWAGANLGDSYSPHITSYDYDAPISEAGGYGQPGIGGPNKFDMVRSKIQEHLKSQGLDASLPDVPPASPVRAYGAVQFGPSGMPLLQIAPQLSGRKAVSAERPDIMEEYGQRSGLVLYRIALTGQHRHAGHRDSVLQLAVHDYAKVFIDGHLVASISRNDDKPEGQQQQQTHHQVILPAAVFAARAAVSAAGAASEERVVSAASGGGGGGGEEGGDVSAVSGGGGGGGEEGGGDAPVLDILVEAMGRSNFGCDWDFKGIVSKDVMLDGHALTGWTVYPLPLDDLEEEGDDKAQGEADSAGRHGAQGSGRLGGGGGDKDGGDDDDKDGDDGDKDGVRAVLAAARAAAAAAAASSSSSAGRRLLQQQQQEISTAADAAVAIEEGATGSVCELGGAVCGRVLRGGPELFVGAFEVPQGLSEAEEGEEEGSGGGGNAGHLPDTFVHLPGFGKGIVWVNGFNLGWYWPDQGPQMRLYVPGTALREGPNELWLLEMDRVPHDPTVELVDTPDFYGPQASARASQQQQQPWTGASSALLAPGEAPWSMLPHGALGNPLEQVSEL